MQEEGDAVFF